MFQSFAQHPASNIVPVDQWNTLQVGDRIRYWVPLTTLDLIRPEIVEGKIEFIAYWGDQVDFLHVDVPNQGAYFIFANDAGTVERI
jgi:hypothetical protein